MLESLHISNYKWGAISDQTNNDLHNTILDGLYDLSVTSERPHER